VKERNRNPLGIVTKDEDGNPVSIGRTGVRITYRKDAVVITKHGILTDRPYPKGSYEYDWYWAVYNAWTSGDELIAGYFVKSLYEAWIKEGLPETYRGFMGIRRKISDKTMDAYLTFEKHSPGTWKC